MGALYVRSWKEGRKCAPEQGPIKERLGSAAIYSASVSMSRALLTNPVTSTHQTHTSPSSSTVKMKSQSDLQNTNFGRENIIWCKDFHNLIHRFGHHVQQLCVRQNLCQHLDRWFIVKNGTHPWQNLFIQVAQQCMHYLIRSLTKTPVSTTLEFVSDIAHFYVASFPLQASDPKPEVSSLLDDNLAVEHWGVLAGCVLMITSMSFGLIQIPLQPFQLWICQQCPQHTYGH